MAVNYENLFSTRHSTSVKLHPGLQAVTKYEFSVTNADPESLPAGGFTDALRAAMRTQTRDLAKYPPPQGHFGLRELTARNLEENRGLETGIDSIFLSSGAGGAAQIIFDAFIDPGDIVLVEEFTYPGTLAMLLLRRANVIHVPTDDQGMKTDALENAIQQLASHGKRPTMIYTISVYHNPMGMTLSLERRKRLLEISHRYGVPILENESYADFVIDGDPLPPTVISMDDHDSVMYVSSYTKLLACGLRLGFGVIPEQVRKHLEPLRFGGSPSHLASMVVHEYLRDHRDEHVERVRVRLKSKRDALLAALDNYFPPTCTWSKPTGGMMVWVQLPEGANTWDALDKAIEAGVKYNPGPLFRAERDCPNYMRLAYSHNSPEEIWEGVGILASVFEREGVFG